MMAWSRVRATKMGRSGWMDSGYILDAELIGLAGELDTGRGLVRKGKGGRTFPRFLA